MKLLTLTVRNYRVHRETVVEFDPRRTLIGGPNECGKSTLVEALHRAFFLKSKGDAGIHREMRSHHGGDPEVEVGFQIGGTDYQIKKRFGKSGSTTLTQSGAATLSGDEAEMKIAHLLGLNEPVARNAVPAQWGHLWIRQGLSGNDPSGDATAQQASLLQRLQQMGGAVALQSDRDGRMANHFREQCEAIFRANGQAKAGSDLESAESAAADAERRWSEARERLERTRAAVEDFEAAVLAITAAEGSLKVVTEQKAEAESRKTKVDSLRAKETEEFRLVQEAGKTLAAFRAEDQRILATAAEIQKRRTAIEPLTEELERLRGAAAQARTSSRHAEEQAGAAFSVLQRARLSRDFTAACVARFEKGAALEELERQSETIGKLKNELAAFRDELARLPEIDEKKLASLRALETDHSKAEAALNSMAAGLDVIASDEDVVAGASCLRAGDSLTLTEDTEIAIGSSLRLRVRPGGGTSLAEARRRSQVSRRDLQNALESLGVKDVSAVAQVLTKRQGLTARIEATGNSLNERGADALPEKLAAAREALAAAEAEVSRRIDAAEGLDSPPDLAAARKAQAEAEDRLAEAEQSEASLRAAREVAVRTVDEAESRLAARAEQMQSEKKALDDLGAQHRLLEETHGEKPARIKKLQSLTDSSEAAEKALGATRQQLAELNAEHVRSDVERLQRAIEQAREAITDSRTKREVARATLHSDGSQDPQADLAAAVARREASTDRLESVRRKAQAIRLLADLFAKEQRSLADQFTEPLADKISAYLECLFGAGARAKVVFSGNAFSGLELTRPVLGGAAFSFETLSGGAREQMAAAVRLAMAEVLSPNFGGSLPVIFDDAFAYSDPVRVQTLQRMLDLGASRGLQVIVLTCNPADYAALGAKLVPLAPHANLPIRERDQGINTSDDSGPDAENG